MSIDRMTYDPRVGARWLVVAVGTSLLLRACASAPAAQPVTIATVDAAPFVVAPPSELPADGTDVPEAGPRFEHDIVIGSRTTLVLPGRERMPSDAIEGLRSCYRQALVASPGLTGRLVFTIVGRRPQDVLRSWVKGMPESFVVCAETIMRQLPSGLEGWFPFSFVLDD